MIVFVDTETTGLDPDRHEIWEVGLITPDGKEHLWWLPVDEGRADAYALKINGFYERRNDPNQQHGASKPTLDVFAHQFDRLTAGAYLAGACVSFDEERLRKLLRANGACPRWHYHLVDVEAYAAGKLGMAPPWKSEDLSRAVGVDPETFDRHTALGDARWAKIIYDAVRNQ